MGFFSRFEGRMEDTFEGVADKMFDAPLSPVQIAKKAEKMMRREKMVGAGRQYAPTLYTVLVNPDDDQRLFGYYPTLAGETETYLSAKAASEGLVMDGQPLVRFIVDDELKHGKFDVIAEAVAAPIVAQLRAEEMERYGIAPARGHANAAGSQGYGQPAGAAGGAYGTPADAYGADPYGGYDAVGYNDGYGYGDYDYDGYDQAGEGKPPLPYVPEDKIDYSIDYGEYTFDSQDFDDYRDQSASVHEVASGAAAGVAGAAAAGAAGAGVPNTVAFVGGADGAQPDARSVRARLICQNDGAAYDLASTRLVLGRASRSDIVVDDINVSRTHAELRRDPQGAWVISDLGSTNGTFVNGQEITSRTLRDGDRITLGTTNFTFMAA